MDSASDATAGDGRAGRVITHRDGQSGERHCEDRSDTGEDLVSEFHDDLHASDTLSGRTMIRRPYDVLDLATGRRGSGANYDQARDEWRRGDGAPGTCARSRHVSLFYSQPMATTAASVPTRPRAHLRVAATALHLDCLARAFGLLTGLHSKAAVARRCAARRDRSAAPFCSCSDGSSIGRGVCRGGCRAPCSGSSASRW